MDIDDIKSQLKTIRASWPNQENIPLFFSRFRELKKKSLEQGDQDSAKEIWCLEQTVFIHKIYTSAYNQMKESEFRKAWETLINCERYINSLRPHFHEHFPSYFLDFIDEKIKLYQGLFPYTHFASRGMIIKKKECSVCQQVVNIRTPCGHKPGEIYNGEICYRKITEAELLEISIVKHPEDKNCVLMIDGIEYNYTPIDFLMGHIDSPFEEWSYKIKYLCPCGSKKLISDCCEAPELKPIKHYQFEFYSKPQIG